MVVHILISLALSPLHPEIALLAETAASYPRNPVPRAFSSEVETGSREENASKQKSRARF
jgi:hypothetical protein